MEIIAKRQFDPMYMWLDIAFLLLFTALLVVKKKYMTVAVGLLFGVVYMFVDYGIFHLATGSREIFNGYSMFWVLLWMSMSYGFTNFTWIWLWISKDKNLFEWSLLIVLWWICCPILANAFSYGAPPVIIQRTTSAYHGGMALVLFIGYALLIAWNVLHKEKETRVNIPWLLAIGILVQLAWECALLLGGIRSAGFESFSDKISTLVVNSLLETNLGMPYIYFLFLVYSSRFTERMKKRPAPVSLLDRLRENNARRVRDDSAQDPYFQ